LLTSRYFMLKCVYYPLLDWLAFSVIENERHRPQGRAGLVVPQKFFDNLSRFAGVSEALAERESAGEIPSAAEGSVS